MEMRTMTEKILEGMKFVPAEKAINCLHYSLQMVLQYYGFDRSEEILGGNWGFFYYKKAWLEGDSEQHQLLITNYDWRNPGQWGGYLLPGADFQLIWDKVDEPQYGRERLQNRLNEGLPVILLGDSYFLPWRTQFGFRHQAHWFVAYGYDVSSVFFIDGWEGTFRGTMTWADLEAAQSYRRQLGDSCEPLFPNAIEHQMMVVVRSGDRGEPWSADPLLYRVATDFLTKKPDGGMFPGYGGMLTLAEDVARLPEYYDENDLRRIMTRLFEFFFILVSHRTVFLQTLNRAEPDLGSNRGELMERLRSVLQQWLVLRNLFYKAATVNAGRKIETLSRRLRELAEMEKETWSMLLERVGK